MDENGFYSAAASCKFHNNFYGGLAKHSLEVFWEADKLWLKLENNDHIRVNWAIIRILTTKSISNTMGRSRLPS